MAQRAECVMLNKGPFIDEAISMLADILAPDGAPPARRSPPTAD